MDDALYFTEHHHQVREMVRDFSASHIAPVARELDRTSEFPWENIKAMGELGLAGELRRIRDLPQRIAEAGRLGFATAIVPAEGGRRGVRTVDGMRVVEATDIATALHGLRLREQPRHLRPLD